MSDDDPLTPVGGGDGDEAGADANADDAGTDANADDAGTDVDVRTPSGSDSPGPIARFWNADEGALAAVRDLLSSALMVLLVAGLLFGVSGVWPPMVAVKSGSMNPHMYKGDLVFVTEDDRFAGQNAVAETGVVTNHVGQETGYSKFGKAGDVIVYRPDGRVDRDPIIHRAMFFVEKGENWYPEANKSHLPASIDGCDELRFCPAPTSGFITKGDNPQSNEFYDQVQGLSQPVQPEWVQAKAMVRIPALGWIRLKWAEMQRGAVSAAAALLLVGGWKQRRRLLGAA